MGGWAGWPGREGAERSGGGRLGRLARARGSGEERRGGPGRDGDVGREETDSHVPSAGVSELLLALQPSSSAIQTPSCPTAHPPSRQRRPT